MTDVLEAARSKIGAPYVWGAKGPDSFDCSGYVSWSEAQDGVSVPSFTDWIASAVPQVSDGPKAADILLYRYSDPGQPGVQYPHVEFALGDGRVIGARWPGGVQIYGSPLNQPYEIHRPAASAATSSPPAAAPPPEPVAEGGSTTPPAWALVAAALAGLWALDLL